MNVLSIEFLKSGTHLKLRDVWTTFGKLNVEEALESCIINGDLSTAQYLRSLTSLRTQYLRSLNSPRAQHEVIELTSGSTLEVIELTSGSLVSMFVWMSILPILTSLQTSHRAGSITSPALSTDTPNIYSSHYSSQGITIGPNILCTKSTYYYVRYTLLYYVPYN